MTVAVEFKNIRKCFPGVVANDDISFVIHAGEVMAIVGENGAGKTTLVNSIYGMHRPDSGEILVNGQRADLRSPADAIALGIGMVHQHFMLVGPLTVAENVVLGSEPVKCGLVLDRKLIHAEVAELAKRFGLSVDTREIVERLPVGIQQRVEILKALYRGAEILILDEPTAVLTPQETRELFKTIGLFKSQGKTVIFISHKLGEVLAIADRIAVMRCGKLVTVADAAQTDKADLSRLMMGVEKPAGEHPSLPVVATETRGDADARNAEVILDAVNLRAKNDRGIVALNDVSFSVRKGEILGVAGVEGNGQAELVEVLTGLRRPVSGVISIGGRTFSKLTPGLARRLRIGHIPQDRRKEGLIPAFSLAENLALGRHNSPPLANGPWLNAGACKESARRLLTDYDVVPRNENLAASALSGGNQQKLVIAREISMNPELLVAVQPTRGLDVRAAGFVHEELLAQRAKGKGLLLVSLDIDEILALSDRIMVMYGGRIAGTLSRAEATEEKLGMLMLGGAPSGGR